MDRMKREVINQLKKYTLGRKNTEKTEISVLALNRLIFALEEEHVLDKIRAEVEALPKTYPFVNHIDKYVKEDDVKKIIDKYKAESEE